MTMLIAPPDTAALLVTGAVAGPVLFLSGSTAQIVPFANVSFTGIANLVTIAPPLEVGGGGGSGGTRAYALVA